MREGAISPKEIEKKACDSAKDIVTVCIKLVTERYFLKKSGDGEQSGRCVDHFISDAHIGRWSKN